MLLAEKYAAADMNAALDYREEMGGNKKLYGFEELPVGKHTFEL